MFSLKIESPKVRELGKQNEDDGSVNLTWKIPDGFVNKNARYVVEYNGERYFLSIDQTEYTIKSGLKDKSFPVKVRIFFKAIKSLYQILYLFISSKFKVTVMQKINCCYFFLYILAVKYQNIVK